jgi:hypothetical protein
MKIITAIALVLCTAAHLNAELVNSPWLLKRHGAYIEMTEGYFRRSSAIANVQALISVYYEKDNKTLLSKSFPLSEKGIADFKTLDRSKFEGATCKVSVMVYINGEIDRHLVKSEGDDPIKNWDAFNEATFEARAQVEELLNMATQEG